MPFTDIIQRLEKYISFIKKAIVAFAIAEAILVILIGIVSGYLSADNHAIRTISGSV